MSIKLQILGSYYFCFREFRLQKQNSHINLINIVSIGSLG